MFAFALVAYFIFILGYGAFAAALIYHVRKFAISEDPLHTFVTPFLATSIVLVIVSLYFFIRIPWNMF